MPKAAKASSTPRRTAPQSKRTLLPLSKAKIPVTREHDVGALPDVYCMALDGDCLAPLVPDRSAVVVKRSETYGVGDLVCIWFRPEAVSADSHQAWLKRVTLNAPPWVKKFPYRDHPESECLAMIMVEQLNPLRSYAVKCSDILAIHKAVGHVPAGGTIAGTISSANVIAIGDGVVPQLGGR